MTIIAKIHFLVFILSSLVLAQTHVKSGPTRFLNQVSTIRQIPLPYYIGNCGHTRYEPYYDDTLSPVLKSDGRQIVGRIFPHETFVTLVQGFAHFTFVPYLVTYTKNGDLIDQLLAQSDCGSDLGLDPHSSTLIGADKVIAIFDSLFTKDYDSKNEYIKGSDRVTISKRTFRLDASGHFKQVSENHKTIRR